MDQPAAVLLLPDANVIDSGESVPCASHLETGVLSILFLQLRLASKSPTSSARQWPGQSRSMSGDDLDPVRRIMRCETKLPANLVNIAVKLGQPRGEVLSLAPLLIVRFPRFQFPWGHKYLRD
jgi:hypothetical protein